MFLPFLIRFHVPKVDGGAGMSENYKYYTRKLAEREAARNQGPLQRQLRDLLRVVKRCEAMWALEDRIERAL